MSHPKLRELAKKEAVAVLRETKRTPRELHAMVLVLQRALLHCVDSLGAKHPARIQGMRTLARTYIKKPA